MNQRIRKALGKNNERVYFVTSNKVNYLITEFRIPKINEVYIDHSWSKVTSVESFLELTDSDHFYVRKCTKKLNSKFVILKEVELALKVI